MNNSKIKQACEDAINILAYYRNDFTNYFQTPSTYDNFYKQSENVEWTTGFLTGEYWMAYELTGDDKFKESALVHVDSFLKRIEQHVDVDNHDMGFLYSLSCVAAYKLCGSEKGKKAALMAADNLVSRFNHEANFIQAWGEVNAKDNFRLIIDCLMNMAILYWASEVSGDSNYESIARKHTKTSLKHLIREDHSTYHTYFFDYETSKPLYGKTHQGYKDDSAWSRGQAWGVYGLALAYRYTKDDECIDLFYKVTDYFINHLPKDYVPYWDFCFTDGTNEPKDSSAAAIAICGIFEMAKYLEKDKANYYLTYADKMLESLIVHYRVVDVQSSNALLLHGVYVKKSPYNPAKYDLGVDEGNGWGDYFYLEALIRK
ncbi:MAG: glycoside hydrolase family 88 protein, partial [Erysipelotrichaceae bacterium]